MQTLGQGIRKARIDKRLKQKELCAQASISQRYLSAIELDKADPSFGMVVRLADRLDVSLDSLIGRTGGKDDD